MQRPLSIDKQVVEIRAFLKKNSLVVKHADILELVARLNGAPHWNALEARKAEASAGSKTPQQKGGPAGFRQVNVESTEVLFIGIPADDDAAQWALMRPVGAGACSFERLRDLSLFDVHLVRQFGVAVEALVTHPRVDRHGTPDVAVTAGLLQWLHTAQQLSTCDEGRFELYAEDTGDDEPAYCVLTVRVPRIGNLHGHELSDAAAATKDLRAGGLS